MKYQLPEQKRFICVGLDIELDKMPKEYDPFPIKKRITDFVKEIVKLTRELSAAYKLNKAFIDQYGGPELLKTVIKAVRLEDSNKPIFIDCKIGDIANTMNAYLKNIFD